MDKEPEEEIKKLDPKVASEALILAALNADQLEAKNGLMMPRKKYIAKKAVELAKALTEADAEVNRRIEAGFAAFSERFESLAPGEAETFAAQLKTVREKLFDIVNASGDLREKVGEYIGYDTLEEMLGFTPDMMHLMYGIGRELLSEKKAFEAAGVFYILLALNKAPVNYWMGIALAEKEMRNYPASLVFFGTVILFAPENPIPRYNCAEMYLELGQFDEALIELEALRMIIEQTGQKSLQAPHDALYGRVMQKKRGG